MDEQKTDTGNELLNRGAILNKINLRSELAQEIISSKPAFIERWALFIFICILLLMLMGSWFVKYPDIIQANAVLTAKNAPKEIIPKLDARLVRLFVRNKEHVDHNQIIAWLESTANPEEVLNLYDQIDSILKLLNSNKFAQVSAVADKRYNNLGELQADYQEFVASSQLFNDYMVNGFFAQKRKVLENDIDALNKTAGTIKSQLTLTKKDILLAEESYNMNKKLFDEKVLTKEELRTQTSKYVNKQMAIPQLESSLLTNEAATREKFSEISQLNHDFAQQKLIFGQKLQLLKSQVENWLDKYVLEPAKGTVFFTTPIQENQYLKMGRLVGYINPDNSCFFAEAYLSQTNFGKVDSGQSVQLRIDAYPYQEVGFVEGTLDYISSVPSDSGFLATIKFNNGLITNNHKVIPYKNGLKAQAIIITKNVRLINRLYYNVVKTTSIGNN